MSSEKRRILVVDDEPYIGRIIQLRLQDGPYVVEVYQDGQTALERLRRDDAVALILLDIVLPHMSGIHVLEALRRLPGHRRTPVIMLTAKGQEADREQARALGVSDFLTKPFSPKKLLARIEEIFRG